MRLLAEIFVLAALAYLGWEKPYRDWLPDSLAPRVSAHAGTEARGPAAGTPTAQRIAEANQPVQNRSFTGHIIYADETGRKYWLDGAAKRHYEP
jgi:hypothetical protein